VVLAKVNHPAPDHEGMYCSVVIVNDSAPARVSRTERLTREARGIALYEERGHDIQQIECGLYSVPSCTGRGDYLVHYGDTAESCECGDNQRRGMVCKHLYAAALFTA